MKVMYDVPYMMNYRPLILNPWMPEFHFNEEFPTKILLWITFPKLPLNC